MVRQGLKPLLLNSVDAGRESCIDRVVFALFVAFQHLGGAIAWGSSELPVILVVVALISQWARQDRRAATRYDRHSESDYADDELEAYNAMLRELARDRR